MTLSPIFESQIQSIAKRKATQIVLQYVFQTNIDWVVFLLWDTWAQHMYVCQDMSHFVAPYRSRNNVESHHNWHYHIMKAITGMWSPPLTAQHWNKGSAPTRTFTTSPAPPHVAGYQTWLSSRLLRNIVVVVSLLSQMYKYMTVIVTASGIW